ncbi:MAG: hypothetical protein ACTHJ6_01455 [Oryzihumus sp.]
MIAVGFFAQRHGGARPGPDLRAALADPLPAGDRADVVRYLLTAHVLAATSSRVVDVLNPELGEVSGENVHTDGEYLWPEDLAYYVQTYGARPPQAFLEHIRRAGSPRHVDSASDPDLIDRARNAMATMQAAGTEVDQNSTEGER